MSECISIQAMRASLCPQAFQSLERDGVVCDVLPREVTRALVDVVEAAHRCVQRRSYDDTPLGDRMALRHALKRFDFGDDGQ